jgi:hypothetical protein
VAELVESTASKSGFLTEVLVRVRPGAPLPEMQPGQRFIAVVVCSFRTVLD